MPHTIANVKPESPNSRTAVRAMALNFLSKKFFAESGLKTPGEGATQ
jgi:hypothetical protein